MDIGNIKGRSSYIKGGTNTGVYEFLDGSVLLIDAGHSVNRGVRIASMLKKQGKRPDYMIATHEHFDHFEAYAGLKETNPQIKLIAHPLAKPYIENLYLGMAYMTSSSMPSFYGRKNHGVTGKELCVGDYRVDIVVDRDIEIKGEKISIIHSPGHSSSQILVMTPDRVCYMGDAVLDSSIIDTYDMPFLFDIKMHKESLKKIQAMDFEYGVIGHAKAIYTKAQIEGIVDKNLEVLLRYENDIINILDKPSTREEILSNLMIKNNIKYNYTTYHYNNSTVGSYIAKLSNEGKIDLECKDGKIYYHKK